MSKKKEREALASSIEKFADSMLSHLPWCIEKNPKEKDPRKFHVDTVIEYAREILKNAQALK